MTSPKFIRAFLYFIVSSFVSVSYAELQVSPLQALPEGADTSAELVALVKEMIGPNVVLVDDSVRLVHKQSVEQLGTFSGGLESVSSALEGMPIGMPNGVILSTGRVKDAEAADPFSENKQSTDFAGSDFSGKNPLNGNESNDVTYNKDMVLLEFVVKPANDTLRVDFVFASEEYEDAPSGENRIDRVCTTAIDNDRFGIFISPDGLEEGADETNVAVWGDGRMINSLSLHEAEFLSCSSDNRGNYLSNNPTGKSDYKTSYDGFSVPLAGQVNVTAGNSYRVRVAIADTGDGIYDSAVFIRFFSSPAADGASISSVSYPFGSDGLLSTKTPDASIVARILDSNGPIDHAELDESNSLQAGVFVDELTAELSISGELYATEETFSVAFFDYIAWHPCNGVSTFNPCDYDYLSDETRVSKTQEVTLSFADASVDKSEVSADKLSANTGEVVTITVQLKDFNSTPLVSGGDSVIAISSSGLLKGLINDTDGVTESLDLGNGQYQFQLESAEGGEITVYVMINGPDSKPLVIDFVLVGPDSDGDGIPDKRECTFLGRQLCLIEGIDDIPIDLGIDLESAIDSDGDGLPDYLDLDSDDDGIPDQIEAGSDPLNPVDSDGDKVEDFRDWDSDNDGLSDTRECPTPSNCIDVDGNGIPDYLDYTQSQDDVEILGVIKTQTDGIGSTGAFSLGGLIFMLGVRLRRKAGFFLLGLPLLLSLGSHEAVAQSGSFYTGFNLGMSSLAPDISGTPDLTLDQEQDVLMRLNFGYDIHDHLSIEAYWADLGEVTFSPLGALSYEAIGVGLVGHYYYMGQARSYGSGSVFLKSGLTSLLNASSELDFENNNSLSLYYGLGTEYWLNDSWSLRLEFTTYDKDATEISAGVAYRFSAKDTPVLPKNKTKRKPLGRYFKVFSDSSETVESTEQGTHEAESIMTQPEQKSAASVAAEPAHAVRPRPKPASVARPRPKPLTTKPIQAVAPKPEKAAKEKPAGRVIKDEDKDGILDRYDECPATPEGIRVGKDGCAEYQGIWGIWRKNPQP